jgi:hypothetical protein
MNSIFVGGHIAAQADSHDEMLVHLPDGAVVTLASYAQKVYDDYKRYLELHGAPRMPNQDERVEPVTDTTQGAVMRRVDQVIDDLQRGRVSSRQVGELEPAVQRAKSNHGAGRAITR